MNKLYNGTVVAYEQMLIIIGYYVPNLIVLFFFCLQETMWTMLILLFEVLIAFI